MLQTLHQRLGDAHQQGNLALAGQLAEEIRVLRHPYSHVDEAAQALTLAVGHYRDLVSAKLAQLTGEDSNDKDALLFSPETLDEQLAHAKADVDLLSKLLLS